MRGGPGIDFLAQGYAGLLSAERRARTDDAVRLTVPLIDVMTSRAGLQRPRSRRIIARGRRRVKVSCIEVSLLDALTHAMTQPDRRLPECQLRYAAHGQPQPLLRTFAACTTCKDGRVVITCPSQKFFVKLCEALGTDWADDERFATIEARKANEDALDAAIEARFADQTRQEIVELLVQGDLLTAPINEIRDVVVDPQIRHNDMIVTVPHEKLGEVDVTGVPIKMHGTPGSVRLPPPMLGQHTEAVLAELGYDAAEIEGLVADAIVGTREGIERAKAERRAAREAKA